MPTYYHMFDCPRERGRIIRSGESEWLLEYYEYSTQSINHAYLAQLLPATRVYSTFYIPVSSVPSFSLQFLFLPPFFSRRLPVAPHLATYTRFNRLLNFFSPLRLRTFVAMFVTCIVILPDLVKII